MQAKVVHWDTASCCSQAKVVNYGFMDLASWKNISRILNDADATKSTVLHTGDIAYIDQDGYSYILDRLKDAIKYKGF